MGALDGRGAVGVFGHHFRGPAFEMKINKNDLVVAHFGVSSIALQIVDRFTLFHLDLELVLQFGHVHSPDRCRMTCTKTYRSQCTDGK